MPDCTTLAKLKIGSLSCSEGYFRLRLKGMKQSLYFASSFGTHSVYQTIAEQLYPRGWHYYEIPETRVVGDIVLDAGCAEGIFPYLCSARARQIFAFEPSPDFLWGLERSFQKSPNVHIIPTALGSCGGTMFLEKRGISSFITEHVTGTRASVCTVDDFCGSNAVIPTYLKADLEGFEIEFLRGARDTIRRCRPKIAITTYHRKEHADEIQRILLSINPEYRVRVKGIESEWGSPVMLHAW